MPNVQPIQQSAGEDLKNALTIAEMGALGYYGDSPAHREVTAAFADIARLLAHALVQLGEPSLSAMQAGEILLKEWQGTPEPQRQLRDTLAGILAAQVSGIVPKTWEVS